MFSLLQKGEALLVASWIHQAETGHVTPASRGIWKSRAHTNAEEHGWAAGHPLRLGGHWQDLLCSWRQHTAHPVPHPPPQDPSPAELSMPCSFQQYLGRKRMPRHMPGIASGSDILVAQQTSWASSDIPRALYRPVPTPSGCLQCEQRSSSVSRSGPPV